MAEEEQKETHVQDQGGFEGRRRYTHQDGFEGRYKQVPPMVKEVNNPLPEGNGLRRS